MTALEKDTDLSMRTIAEFTESIIGKDYGFVVLVFPFNDDRGVANYISNASRKEMIKALRQKADILEQKLDIDNTYDVQ